MSLGQGLLRKYIYRMIREGFNEMSSQVRGFRSSDGTEKNYVINIFESTWIDHNIFSKQTIIKIIMITTDSVNENYLFPIKRFIKILRTGSV